MSNGSSFPTFSCSETISILPHEKIAIWVVENRSIFLRLFYKMTQAKMSYFSQKKCLK
jgi:hypothetical protein